MKLSEINSLVELYFKKSEEIEGKKPFLKWLKPEKPTYNWEDITTRIFKLSNKIKSLINDGDRCLILSENRPYWLVSDIAIMNAGGISVPIFTTYSENDYEYILNDCKPSLIIVSNQNQFKKIKNFINPEVIKIISFEKIDTQSLLISDILNGKDFQKEINKNLKIGLVDFGPLYPLGPNNQRWQNGVNLNSLLPLIDEIHPTFYFADLDLIKEKYDVYKKVLNNKVEMIPAMRTILPQVSNQLDLKNQLQVFNKDASGFSFYNYSFMNYENLDWIHQSLSENGDI